MVTQVRKPRGREVRPLGVSALSAISFGTKQASAGNIDDLSNPHQRPFRRTIIPMECPAGVPFVHRRAGASALPTIQNGTLSVPPVAAGRLLPSCSHPISVPTQIAVRANVSHRKTTNANVGTCRQIHWNTHLGQRRLATAGASPSRLNHQSWPLFGRKAPGKGPPGQLYLIGRPIGRDRKLQAFLQQKTP